MADGHEFHLYPSRTASRKKTYRVKRKVMFYFDDPVRGLLPGAPVQLRGYKIGEVLDVSLEFNRETGSFRIPVLAEFEPGRVKIVGATDFDSTIEQLVGNGLRASLSSGNLLFGKLLVSLDLHPDEAAVQAETSGAYPVIPTIRGTFGEITHDARALIDELRQAAGTINDFLGSKAFEDSAGDLAATLDHILLISEHINEKTAPQVTAVLSGATSTLQEARVMLAANSTAYPATVSPCGHAER